METQDWLVTNDGNCQGWTGLENHLETLDNQYRLYRFLTDLEDILIEFQSDRQRLQAICPLVRKLLTSSDWLQGEYLEPDPETGWSVLTLYDEPDFPLTVQTVVWLPGTKSPIHNHATWGIIAIIDGEEKNTFWQRNHQNGGVEKVGEKILTPGEIITFMPDAIHDIECIGDEPTISFNLYGETDYSQRFEFDPVRGTAENF
ncbi:MAG: cupin [Sphaerospermopsis sp. SIO1G1]|nr:cupin [Sphaerospermopsis sp. SIO1G1]